MTDKDFNLSEKRYLTKDFDSLPRDIWLDVINFDDVKEFIRLLKEELKADIVRVKNNYAMDKEDYAIIEELKLDFIINNLAGERFND